MIQLESKLKNIDRLIFTFLLLFVATLNISIFLNQIGFFSVYFLIIIKSYQLKENPIKKTELNQLFLILIFIFLITALFSEYKTEALIRSTKKILLIPIVYSIVYFVDDVAKSKKIIYTYLGAALATSFVYILFSVYHFVYHLYSLEGKGPSPFQYVMTAGGLMSFTLLFFFSYLLNEKVTTKIKIYLFVSFCILLIAVISSYTRAAWLGTVVGLLTILILKKKWKLLVAFLVIVSIYFLYNKNESKVEIFKVNQHNIELINSYNTQGRANDVLINKNNFIIADYENGILFVNNKNVFNRIVTKIPVTDIKLWNDSLIIVYSINHTFYLFKQSRNNLTLIDSFFTRGKTFDFKIYNSKFYVADEDSGLTIYENPNTLKNNFIKYKGISQFLKVDSTILIYNDEKQSLLLKKIINDKYFENLDSLKINSPIGKLFNINNKALFQMEDKLIVLNVNSNKIKIDNSFKNFTGIFKSVEYEKNYYFLTTNGKIYKSEYSDSKFNLKELYDFKKTINGFDIKNDTLVIAYYYRNRFTSIFDKYYFTNYERLNIWKTGIKIFLNNPILGVGDIDLQKIYVKYKEPYLKENFGHLHNNLINWLVVYGIVGTILILFVFAKLFLFLIKFYNTYKNEKIFSSFILGSIASFVAFTFSGVGEYNFGDQEIMTVLWFIIGMNLALYKILRESKIND